MLPKRFRRKVYFSLPYALRLILTTKPKTKNTKIFYNKDNQR
jgi:hypothetical protein